MNALENTFADQWLQGEGKAVPSIKWLLSTHATT